MIFDNQFLRDGEAGGRQAARLLHHTVQKWAAENVVDCKPDIKVMVRVYANLKWLSDTLYKTGNIQTPSLLEDFARGFTTTYALFDFVDVGYGKDRADCKMSETFKLFLSDYHCRQILFGCSHDNGYARLLEQFVDDQAAKTRVTLMEGVPFEKELVVLPFQMKKFDGIFKDAKLVTTPPDFITGNNIGIRQRVDSNGLNATSDPFTPGIRTVTPRISTPYSSTYSPVPQVDGPGSAPYRTDHTRSTSIASSENTSDSGIGGHTWAGMAKMSAGKPFTEVKPRKNQDKAQPKEVLRNIRGQRIDEPLDYDRDEVQRIKKLKMCNQHYIGINGCCHYKAGKSEKCPHRHDIKLNKHELHCLRIVSRETPCKKGMDCDDPHCIYGHRCPFPTANEGGMRGSGACLNGENCRFPREMHGTDTKAVKTVRVGGAF
jgi:hypothetical protein